MKQHLLQQQQAPAQLWSVGSIDMLPHTDPAPPHTLLPTDSSSSSSAASVDRGQRFAMDDAAFLVPVEYLQVCSFCWGWVGLRSCSLCCAAAR